MLSATGFEPFNPGRPPASPVDDGHPPGSFGGVVAQPSPAARLLTDPNSLAERFPSIDEIWNAVADGSLEN
jgi:hypothetical protein